ncbi:acetylornithine transaminase [Buchananella felis]|uniref:acetylornithine transaminase n=1 Tax=Buchananella felis TaxID=3231492 RepID=UPI003527E5D8
MGKDLLDDAPPAAPCQPAAAPGARDVARRHADALLNTFGQVKAALVGGEGSYLFDAAGKRYLDLLGGIAVSCLGHGHPALVEAISAQAASMIHTSNFFATPAQVELAEELLRLSLPPELCATSRVFLSNSGTEANEAALKLALRHGGQARPRLVALQGAFHGRSTGALSLTHKEAYRAPFAPFAREVTFVAPDDAEELARELGRRDVAAVFAEPIQGERGVVALSHDYLRAARRLCSEHGALLVVDEVQTGSYRTGAFLAHHAAGITPDVITLAKSLGGGVPIGATIAVGEPVCSLLGPGSHGSTFGGNPLAAAAALAVLGTVQREGLAARIGELSRRWSRDLAALSGVAQVRAYGLLIAVELEQGADGPSSADVAAALMEAGFIVNAVTPTALRLAPPYTLSDAEADSFTRALGHILTTQAKNSALPAAGNEVGAAGGTSSTEEKR